MREYAIQQGTPEWLHFRTGRATASRVKDILAKLKRKKGEAAARSNYRKELLAERLTGRAIEHYVTSQMQDGIDREPYARALYEAVTGTMVQEAGFVLHPTMDFFGASPDGLCGTDGGLELKSPQETTHLEYLRSRVLPEEYEPQVMANIICCKREWWDFASFNPYMPDPLKLFVVRVYRNDQRTTEIEDAVQQFNDEIEAELKELGRPATVWTLPEGSTEPEYDDSKSFVENASQMLGDEIVI